MSESLEVAAPAPPPLPIAEPSPWGFWPTTALGVAITVAFLSVQSIIALGMIFVLHLGEGGNLAALLNQMEELAMDGRVLSVAMLISFPVMLAGCLLFARLRKGMTHQDYFSLRPMRLAWWFILPPLTILFSFVVGWLLQVAGAPETNPWMLQMADIVREFPLMLIGIVLFAPIAEEFLFRGFLFRGWEESRLRLAGTIFLTSLTWALIHGQYDIYGLIFIFSLGILLGLARWKTGSIYAPITIHLVNNAFAMFMVMQVA